ncbi:MAG: hypothetical protein K0R54_565 [Clostridiaceae bacterium]|jgi:hypothetical protein|nr:hypothetical protein [Clostridiaceae bacterium]
MAILSKIQTKDFAIDMIVLLAGVFFGYVIIQLF